MVIVSRVIQEITRSSSQGTGQEYCHVQWSGHQPFTTIQSITKETLPLCQLTKLYVEKITRCTTSLGIANKLKLEKERRGEAHR